MSEVSRPVRIRILLPWLIAVGGLLVYGLTINSWISLVSLPQVVELSGWTWQRPLQNPLYLLVTWPLRWLPTAWIPLAANWFSVVCAALTLALLARSVMLLPHDRTHGQRLREPDEFSLLSLPTAWLPPVLAAVAIGLQFTFWEHATSANTEMFDLLIFAWCIRCLLEYRVDRRQAWMSKFALAYGAGMANNWALVGFAPAFLAAVVWIKGMDFFQPRFLLRTAAWGTAGLLVYLILPALAAAAPDAPFTFWQALRYTVAMQKQMLMLIWQQKPGVLALYSIVPVLVMGIRWASYFGDTSFLGAAMATFAFHMAHAVILLACLWVMFDPAFSPRLYLPKQHGFELPGLTLYYLAALSIGYYSGYFLLIFGRRPEGERRTPRWLRMVNPIVTTVVKVLVVVVPLGLVLRNLEPIRATNADTLRRYAQLLADCLPEKPALLLADDVRRLYLLEAFLAQRGNANPHLAVHTGALLFPNYHRHLARKYPDRWPLLPAVATNAPSATLEELELVRLMVSLSATNHLHYLHPSFGYYFENFYLDPHGLAYALQLYTGDRLDPPELSPEQIRANEDFWQRAEEEALARLEEQLAYPKRGETGVRAWFMKKLHLQRQPIRPAMVAGHFYSRALNYWGMALRRRGDPEAQSQAEHYFVRAQQMNPENIVARMNQQYLLARREGRPIAPKLSKTVEDQFGKYRSWNQVLNDLGPFEEPNLCFELGRVMVQGKLFRQAAQEFERAVALLPEHLPARLWLAQIYHLGQRPERVLQYVAEIHAHPEAGSLSRADRVQLVHLEAAAHFARTNPAAAARVLRRALREFPDDENLLAGATLLFSANRDYTNSLETVNAHLRVAPDNLSALVNKGFICIQLEAFDEAIAALTRVLELQSNHYEALFNRAIANLRGNHLDAARADYEALLKVFPNAHQIYYGLGEIAFRRQERPAAIRYYELYLTNAPANLPERNFISNRLASLVQPRTP